MRLHFGQSLDGKTHAAGLGARAMGGPVDARAMQHVRAWADAVLVGAATVRVADVPMRLRSQKLVAARVAVGRAPQPRPVVMSRSGALSRDARVFREVRAGEALPLVATGPTGAEAAKRALAGAAEVLSGACCCRAPVHAPDDACLPALLAALSARGVRRLLVEGGGEVAYAFVAADAVDEVFCTVAPFLLGGTDAPTPVAGAGLPFALRRQLRLQQSRVCGDVVLLRYGVRRVAALP